MMYRIPKVDIGLAFLTARDEFSLAGDEPFIESWPVISAGDARFDTILDTGGPEKL
jgi:hypothetical protein